MLKFPPKPPKLSDIELGQIFSSVHGRFIKEKQRDSDAASSITRLWYEEVFYNLWRQGLIKEKENGEKE